METDYEKELNVLYNIKKEKLIEFPDMTLWDELMGVVLDKYMYDMAYTLSSAIMDGDIKVVKIFVNMKDKIVIKHETVKSVFNTISSEDFLNDLNDEEKEKYKNIIELLKEYYKRDYLL